MVFNCSKKKKIIEVVIWDDCQVDKISDIIVYKPQIILWGIIFIGLIGKRKVTLKGGITMF